MIAALIIATEQENPNDIPISLKDVGGIPATLRQIKTFQHAGIDKIVVVASKGYCEIKRKLSKAGVICVENKDDGIGDILGSIAVGVKHIGEDCERIIITPVHTALFSSNTVKQLVQTDSINAIPQYNNRMGNPIILLRVSVLKAFEQNLKVKKEDVSTVEEFAKLLQNIGVDIRIVDVYDSGILSDIRTDTDYHELIESHTLHKIYPKLQIYLSKEKRFFGPGPMQLLELIEETKSLRTACDRMGISYSKGWNIIIEIERNINCEVVLRKRGGSNGGHSSLTDDGIALLERYRKFSRDVTAYALRSFEKYF